MTRLTPRTSTPLFEKNSLFLSLLFSRQGLSPTLSNNQTLTPGFVQTEKGGFLLSSAEKQQNQTVPLSANKNRKVASRQLPMFDSFSLKRSQ